MCKEKVEKLTVIHVCTELKKITNLFICIPPIVLFEMVYRIHKKKNKKRRRRRARQCAGAYVSLFFQRKRM